MKGFEKFINKRSHEQRIKSLKEKFQAFNRDRRINEDKQLEPKTLWVMQ
jgi:hypothetical protein